MLPDNKTLVRYWAAFMADFETCIGRFLSQPGSTFRHFAEVAKNLRLSLIMNLAVGHGKFRHEHYDIVSRIILDGALQFWLEPPQADAKPNHDAILEMRRHLAGFYLTFFLYHKQPFEGKTKIRLDRESSMALKTFLAKVELLPLEEDQMLVKFMFNQLAFSKAFVLGTTSAEYGIELWRRNLMNFQKNKVTKLIFEERKIQDQLAYSTNWQNLVNRVSLYSEHQLSIVSCLQNCVTSTPDRLGILNSGFLSGGDAAALIPNIMQAVASIESMIKKPKLSLEQLTLDQLIQRRVVAEYRERVVKCRKRIIDGPQKPKTEYHKAGSIWGKKKDVEEGHVPQQRRERGGFVRNLWVFLNDLPFDWSPPDPSNVQEAEPDVEEEPSANQPTTAEDMEQEDSNED